MVTAKKRREIEVRAVRTDREWAIARSIRTAVFIEEQACSPEEEWDSYDVSSRHLLAWLGATPVGVARWREIEHANQRVAKLERFAVLREYRGHGYGSELVSQTIEDARRAGFGRHLIHAQKHLEAFYAGFGFDTFGDEFVEAGIPHVKMFRSDAPLASTSEPDDVQRHC